MHQQPLHWPNSYREKPQNEQVLSNGVTVHNINCINTDYGHYTNPQCMNEHHEPEPP